MAGGDLVRGTQIIICSQSLIVLFNLLSSKVLNVQWNQVQETSENRLGIDYINLAKTVLKINFFQIISDSYSKKAFQIPTPTFNRI